METPQPQVRDMLDRLFDEQPVLSKDELVRAVEAARLGEDALAVVRELPDGEYTHEGLMARLYVPLRERTEWREAGMSAHGEPGFVPPNVRRHPSH